MVRMRPIELTVKGLHSFRERQTVDFDKLCAGGVFGIFGPTGSGKSSLLDAITLALYGKVERASGGTQGILNQAEDELAVTFTFDLGIDRPERYRVERAYKRAKNDGLHIASCRLLRLDGGETRVLADKERDVTQKIKEILGLTHEDFTRAVVLPQGKFAEFLTLKGADRRRMLQRLFNLEKYGDRLHDVLRRRLAAVQSRLEAIRAAQLELGDASKEALAAAENAYREAEQKTKDLTAAYEKRKAEFEKAKENREWQKALEDVIRQEEELAQEAAAMAEWRRRVERARFASRVFPYVKEVEDAQDKLARAQREKDEAEAAFQSVRAAEAEKAGIYENIRERCEKEAPAYETRRDNLRQAIRLQEERRDKTIRLNEVSAKLGERSVLLAEKQQLKSELADRRARLRERRDRLRTEWKSLTVKADVRDAVQRAVADKKDIINKQTSYREWREQWLAAQSARSNAEQALAAVRAREKAAEENLRRLFVRYEERYRHIAALTRALETLSVWLSQKEEQTRTELESLTLSHLAAELAGRLQEGSPCPVCGSIHHPAPAAMVEQRAVNEIKARTELYRNCGQWAQKAITAAESHRLAIEQRVARIRDLSEALVPRIGVGKEPEIPDMAAWSDEDLKRWVEEANRELKVFKQDILALDERLKPLLSAYKEDQNNRSTIETQRNEYLKEEKRLQEKLAALENEIKELRAAWQKHFPGFAFDEIEGELERLQALDRKAQQYHEEAERAEQEIEAAEKERESLDQDIERLNREIVELDAAKRETEQTVRQLEAAYQEIMGGSEGDAEEQLRTLEADWEALKAKETAARTDWERAREDRFAAEKRVSNAIALYDSLKERAETATAALNAELDRYGFEDAADVRTAYMTDEQIQEAEDRLARYDQAVGDLKRERARLEAKIGTAPVTEEAFRAIAEAFAELEAERVKAVEERAAAYNAWQALRERHERFMELEDERAEKEALLSKLQKLAAVFRGNGFVEFIAEEQMIEISRDASERLGRLTHGRYALEVDTNGGFVIRDDANGGLRRPVSSLSGGETFLTSLALALSLSAQIQLRGEVPLQFFFLDEGFGTLDQELLDTVVTALEKLHHERMSIGVISHVPELQERLARKLYVQPAEPSGRGSRVRLVGV